MIGRVTSVEQSREGVILDGDHAEGVTSLTVVDALDLDAEGGRLVLPGGEVVEHDAFDPEGVTVPLVGALPVPVEDAELLEVYPPLVSTVAYVATDDEDGATPVPVEVPSGVSGWSTLAPGASLRFEVTKGGDLVATDVISGSLEVAADQVSTGTIRSEWRISREGAIVVGDDETGSGEFAHDGLRFSVPGPNGMPYENVIMTTGETSFGVMAEDGTRLGGISGQGSVSGVTASFEEDITVAGEPLIGSWLDRLPRGVVARAFKSTTGTSIVTGVERAYMRVNATLYPGRLYRIRGWMRANLGISGGGLTLWIRWEAGAQATLSSQMLIDTVNFGFANASTNQNIVGWAEGFLTVPSVTQARFLLSYRGDYGATPAASRTHFYVEDVGVGNPLTGGADDDPGSPDVVSYTTTWTASATRGYDKNGATIPGKDGDLDLWYWHGQPTDFQNAAILFGGGATGSTDGVEVGKTLPQALAGATISHVDIRLRNKVWYSNPVNMAISALNSSTLPSTKQVVRDLVFANRDYQSGEGRWHGLSSSWFTNGTNRGVCLGDYRGALAGGASLTAGSFHGSNDTDPPQLRITYSR